MNVPATGSVAGREMAIAPTAPDHQTHILNRSTEMLLMHEELARSAETANRLEEAARLRRAHRLVAARRASRRAEQAAQRAHRLLSLAVVQ